MDVSAPHGLRRTSMSPTAASMIAGLAICISDVWSHRAIGRAVDAAGIDRELRPSEMGYDNVPLEELVGSHATLVALRLRIQCPEAVPRNQPSLEFRVARALTEFPLRHTSCPPECALEPAESTQRAALPSLSIAGLMADSVDALANSRRTVEDRGFERRPRRARRATPRSLEDR